VPSSYHQSFSLLTTFFTLTLAAGVHLPRVRAERVAVESQARVSVQFVLDAFCVFVPIRFSN